MVGQGSVSDFITIESSSVAFGCLLGLESLLLNMVYTWDTGLMVGTGSIKANISLEKKGPADAVLITHF